MFLRYGIFRRAGFRLRAGVGPFHLGPHPKTRDAWEVGRAADFPFSWTAWEENWKC